MDTLPASAPGSVDEVCACAGVITEFTTGATQEPEVAAPIVKPLPARILRTASRRALEVAESPVDSSTASIASLFDFLSVITLPYLNEFLPLTNLVTIRSYIDCS